MKYLSVILGCLLLVMASCQEESAVETPPDANAILPASPLVGLISQVVQAETSRDDIIDGSSCFGVQLPVLVYANGQPINITSSSGYQAVASIFSASSQDDDTIYFAFPIVIKYRDHHTQTVSSQQQFDQIVSTCSQAVAENSCIDFVYPISLNVYNTESQVPGSVTVSDDSALFAFLDNVSAQTLVSIVYPVTLSTASGGQVVVNDNSSLQNALTSYSGTCSNDPAEIALENVITSGVWYVSYYYHNQNLTSQYSGCTFTFNPNGQVVCYKSNQTYYGTWSLYADDGQLMMDLDFQDSYLGDLDDDWRVDEFLPDEFRMRQTGGGSDPDQLHFSKL